MIMFIMVWLCKSRNLEFFFKPIWEVVSHDAVGRASLKMAVQDGSSLIVLCIYILYFSPHLIFFKNPQKHWVIFRAQTNWTVPLNILSRANTSVTEPSGKKERRENVLFKGKKNNTFIISIIIIIF